MKALISCLVLAGTGCAHWKVVDAEPITDPETLRVCRQMGPQELECITLERLMELISVDKRGDL